MTELKFLCELSCLTSAR